MRRIKSAPANIAEMINRKKVKNPQVVCKSVMKLSKPLLQEEKINNIESSNLIYYINNIVKFNKKCDDNKYNDKYNNKYNNKYNDKYNDKYNYKQKNKNVINIRNLNIYTERSTNILNDVLNDTLKLSLEETAFLGILLNLLNNTFRKDKLKDLTAIIVQNAVKYLIMIFLHNYIYVVNEQIEQGVNSISHLLH